MDTNSWPEGLIRSSGSADWGREVRRAPISLSHVPEFHCCGGETGGVRGGDWSHMSHGCLDLMAACGVEAGGDAIAGSPRSSRSSRSIINLNYRRSKLQRGLQGPGWEEG